MPLSNLCSFLSLGGNHYPEFMVIITLFLVLPHIFVSLNYIWISFCMFLSFIQMESSCIHYSVTYYFLTTVFLRATIFTAVFIYLLHCCGWQWGLFLFSWSYKQCGYEQEFLLTTCPGVELLGHEICTSSASSDNIKLFSEVDVPAYIPTSSVKVFQWLYIPTDTWYLFLYLCLLPCWSKYN